MFCEVQLCLVSCSGEYGCSVPSYLVSNLMAKQKKVKVLTDEQLNTSAVNFIEYAASRGWGLEEVIIYP